MRPIFENMDRLHKIIQLHLDQFETCYIDLPNRFNQFGWNYFTQWIVLLFFEWISFAIFFFVCLFPFFVANENLRPAEETQQSLTCIQIIIKVYEYEKKNISINKKTNECSLAVHLWKMIYFKWKQLVKNIDANRQKSRNFILRWIPNEPINGNHTPIGDNLFRKKMRVVRIRISKKLRLYKRCVWFHLSLVWMIYIERLGHVIRRGAWDLQIIELINHSKSIVVNQHNKR